MVQSATYRRRLGAQFFQQPDVLSIAKSLLGKIFWTNIQGKITSGRIVETEAYEGINDKASHAYLGKRTKRTEAMYADGGVLYIYLCYGMHHLVNVVTHTKEIPHAVLIRAIEPLEGIETMMKRRKTTQWKNIGSGPGKVAQALGLNTTWNLYSLQNEAVAIFDDAMKVSAHTVVAGKRIGVDYAEEDAMRENRFWIKDNPCVSKT